MIYKSNIFLPVSMSPGKKVKQTDGGALTRLIGGVSDLKSNDRCSPLVPLVKSVVGTQKNRLNEMVLLSTQNIT